MAVKPTRPADSGDTTPDWIREPKDLPIIPVYERVLIGEATSAASALGVIGTRWDNAPYEGEAFTGSYVFKIDGHLFTVNVEPIMDAKDQYGNLMFGKGQA